MAHRIEVGLAQGVRDAPGEKVCRRVASELGIGLEGILSFDVYTVDAEFDEAQLEEVAGAPLSTTCTTPASWPRPPCARFSARSNWTTC